MAFSISCLVARSPVPVATSNFCRSGSSGDVVVGTSRWRRSASRAVMSSCRFSACVRSSRVTLGLLVSGRVGDAAGVCGVVVELDCPVCSAASLARFQALIFSRRSTTVLAALLSAFCCSRWRSRNCGSIWKPTRLAGSETCGSVLEDDWINSS